MNAVQGFGGGEVSPAMLRRTMHMARARNEASPSRAHRFRRAGTAALLTAGLLAAAAASPAEARPAAPQAPTVDTRDWAIDANTMVTNDVQEESWYSDGDEPYIAVIGFRSRFGTPGSTTAWFQGGLSELSGGAEDGDVLNIPDAQGRVTFPGVTRLGLGEILGGQNPELVGTITVAMESDATPWSSMRNIFNNLASVAGTEIAGVVETTTLIDAVGNPQALADKFETAVANIEAGTRMSIWQQLGIFLLSWGDPDDRISYRFSAFVAVDDSLTALVDQNIANVLPPDRGFGGGLANRTASIPFSGDGATYTVNYAVG
jgi:hypothetical protein